MRAVVQRVTHAQVDVLEANERTTHGMIEHGLMVLLGVGDEDNSADAQYIADKIQYLRLFEDNEGKMNWDIHAIKGEILLVSQFTLYGDVRKGRRASFSHAGAPEVANQLYEEVVQILRNNGLKVATGQFQTHMQVTLCNDGPVTFLIDSKKDF